jgi:lysophospholipase L1-like esterase
LKEVEVETGAKVVPHEFDLNMLILGDSITEGYDHAWSYVYNSVKNGVKYGSYGNRSHQYSFVLSRALNANAVNQGYSGCRMDQYNMIDPDVANYFKPDVIVVALGVNDWLGQRFKAEANRKTTQQWSDLVDGYMTALEEAFPGVPVIAVLPIQILTDRDAHLNNDQTKEVVFTIEEQLYNQANIMRPGMIDGFSKHSAENGGSVVAILDAKDMLTPDRAHYLEQLSWKDGGGYWAYHPNHEGHIEYGTNLAAAIKELDVYKALVPNNEQ